MALLVVFLVAALFGVFGVRDRTARATRNGYRIEVEHTAVSRAGLRGGFLVEVGVPERSSGALTLAVDASYLDMLDVRRIVPQPAREWSSGKRVYLAFDHPAGSVLDVTVDADVPPDQHRGASGRISVVDGTREIVGVTVRTRVFP